MTPTCWALLVGLSYTTLPSPSLAVDPDVEDKNTSKGAQNAPVVQPELGLFTPLWTRSLFTSGVAPAPPPQPEVDTEWARPLSFLGWCEVEGIVTVYLYRSDTEETFALTQGAIPQEGVMQAVEVENPDSMLDAKVRVRLNGQEAVIAQFEAVSLTEQPSQQTPSANDKTVQPPTTVDSRAQRLTEPVLFTADNTFENSLQAAQQGVSSKSDKPSPASEVIQELRDRKESLYDQYPRPSRP